MVEKTPAEIDIMFRSVYVDGLSYKRFTVLVLTP